MQILLVMAVVSAVVGSYFLSSATAGVGAVALGCLAAILARITQAHDHHVELKRLLAPRVLPPRPNLPDDPLAP